MTASGTPFELLELDGVRPHGLSCIGWRVTHSQGVGLTFENRFRRSPSGWPMLLHVENNLFARSVVKSDLGSGVAIVILKPAVQRVMRL